MRRGLAEKTARTALQTTLGASWYGLASVPTLVRGRVGGVNRETKYVDRILGDQARYRKGERLPRHETLTEKARSPEENQTQQKNENLLRGRHREKI